jgi:hypothetical protein
MPRGIEECVRAYKVGIYRDLGRIRCDHIYATKLSKLVISYLLYKHYKERQLSYRTISRNSEEFAI